MTRGKYWFVYHLIASWFLYNIALGVALYMSLGGFRHEVFEVLTAMAVFGVGLAAYQWDIWNLYGKTKVNIEIKSKREIEQ